MLFGESLQTVMIVQYHVDCISCLWQDLQDLFYWVVYNLSVLHGLCCLSETLVARVLKVTVIPDCSVL